MTDKSFNATAAGQKAMCNRAGRIALLHQMNEAVRSVTPEAAWSRSIIDQVPDSEIDSWRDSILADYNKAMEAKKAQVLAR